MTNIDAFELWIRRRMMYIIWKEKNRNEWGRQRVGEPKTKRLLAKLKEENLPLCACGHWKRRSKSMVYT